MVKTEGPQMTSQYGAYALHVGLGGLHAHARATGSPMQARTHRPTCNTYCSSTATIIRERASMSRYTYIVPLV